MGGTGFSFEGSPDVSLASFKTKVSRLGYVALEEESAVREERVYYDTQGGRFYSKGYRLRWDRGRGLWQLYAEGRVVAEQPGDVGRPPEDGVLGRRVAGISRGQPLIPHLAAVLEEHSLALESPVRSRIVLSEQSWGFAPPPEVSPAGRDERRDGGEGEDGGVRAGGEEPVTARCFVLFSDESPSEVFYLRTLLRDLFGMAELEFDPLTTGLDAIGRPIPGAPYPSKWNLDPGDSIRTAGRKILARLGYKMEANTEGAMLDLDPEYVHDLRVATRRARFALKMLRPLMPEADCAGLREDLERVAGTLGDVRDLDVFLEQLEGLLERAHAPEEARSVIRDTLHAKREPALEALRRLLGSAAYTDLLGRLGSTGEVSTGEGAHAPLDLLASAAIRKALKKVARRQGADAGQITAEELHALRIAFKGLRYTCEFFGEAFPGSMAELIGQFVQFQDVLGLFNDAQVAMRRLRDLAVLLEKQHPDSRELLLTLGALLQLQRDMAGERRMEFLKIWKKFPKRRKRLNKLVAAMKGEAGGA